jgi:hypothetical protein
MEVVEREARDDLALLLRTIRPVAVAETVLEPTDSSNQLYELKPAAGLPLQYSGDGSEKPDMNPRIIRVICV